MAITIKRADSEDAYQAWKKSSCLLGWLIVNIKREFGEYDFYYHGDYIDGKFSIKGWDIKTQVYERTIQPFVDRLKPQYFFRDFNTHPTELVGGCISGVVVSGGMIAFTAVTAAGLLMPWYAIIAICLPSL